MSAISVARAARFIFRPSAYRRHMSEVVPTRSAFLVDTLALDRGMEAHGIESEHAEAITVMNDGLESVAKSFVSQDEMQKNDMIRDADFSKFKFKFEVQNSQVHHFSSLQRSTDKLQVDFDLLYWRIRDGSTKHTAKLTKQMAEFNDRITKQIAESNDRITKQIAELTKQMVESNDRIAKQIAESNDRIAKRIAESNDRTTKLDHVIQANEGSA